MNWKRDYFKMDISLVIYTFKEACNFIISVLKGNVSYLYEYRCY